MLRQGLDELAVLIRLEPSNTDWLNEVVLYRILLGDLLADENNAVAAQAALAEASTPLAKLMALPVTRRNWRIGLTGHAVDLRARLASTPSEKAAANGSIEAYLADVQQYERSGSEVPAVDMSTVGSVELAHGDLLHDVGREADAQTAWRSASVWLRSNAERHDSAALTLMGLVNLRLGRTQDARACADTVRGTTYRHPAYADLQQQLGRAQ